MNHGQINGVNIFKFKYLGSWSTLSMPGDVGGGGIQLRSIFLKPAAFEVLRTNFGSEKVYFQKVST